ncbi:osmoprotectant NAGGN system M42 family peptidase [Desulfatitalea tepidiphila]|uniref:osmoprotectant NAGGN system M42 family peptidase n=1 Tax=Desulfatitalea tepidiphila TaxID=1185843 RepID=UPI000AF9BD0B|nr:osmoprotectant NAGGN system M42 family peptidase [Desulfatitalea tepidiphila]
MMEMPAIDSTFLKKTLVDLLNIPSPSGYSDQIVHYVGEVLQHLAIDFEVTRRGAIRAVLEGTQSTVNRALAVHLDTLGAMTRELKENGRLGVAPVGTWSSRFAEGARVTIFNRNGPQRGTVLPLKASGHVFNDEINTQPIHWDQIEVRVDEPCHDARALQDAGYEIGDFIAFDATPEITSRDYINARHLDDKAGVALLLTAAKMIQDHQIALPVNCCLLFTISEEVGSGASSIVYGDVAEMVVIDHAPVAPGQASSEYAATICMMDQSGPFDYHLSRKLVRLCEENDIPFRKDVFRYYRSDSASAIEAGNDTRTALIGFGVDASHGHERTHMDTLTAVTRLITLYMQSGPTFLRDKDDLAGLEGFPHQPSRDVIRITT